MLEDVGSDISGGNSVGAEVGLAHVGAGLLIAPEVQTTGWTPPYLIGKSAEVWLGALDYISLALSITLGR